MHIVVNQLTRMDAPRICVAGIQPTTGRHIRPTTGRSNPLTRTLLAEEGGPLALGALIDLGEVRTNPDPPETEDHLFWPGRMAVLGRVSSDRYLEILRAHAQPSLKAIFGPSLARHSRTYAVDRGQGSSSLGILRSQRKSSVLLDRYGKLRLRLPTKEGAAYLPLTDLRLVEVDHTTINANAVEDLNARMGRGIESLLLLGLSRAYRKDGDEHERHWLQVNGICMSDKPIDQLP
jgi:hypothetical protein